MGAVGSFMGNVANLFAPSQGSSGGGKDVGKLITTPDNQKKGVPPVPGSPADTKKAALDQVNTAMTPGTGYGSLITTPTQGKSLLGV